ncbi:hypothetical protein QAD02_017468 [Eretmocerus hayati]|uniref:Uncharacterized protein n=1 Tax=Eretmocerus hayati TaxID=131215 RepID=A0ACC2PF76_9HYME|nr:hypothetical protein QAD02_017468 [Eretmocerus hayati]
MACSRSGLASYALCLLLIQVRLSNSRTSWRLSADRVVKNTNPAPALSLQDEVIFDILTGSVNFRNGAGWTRSATSHNDRLDLYCNECQGYLNGAGSSASVSAHQHERRHGPSAYSSEPIEPHHYDTSNNNGSSSSTSGGSHIHLPPEQQSGSSGIQGASASISSSLYTNGQQQQQLSCASVAQSCAEYVLDCGKPVNFTYYDNLIGVANRDKHAPVPEPAAALAFSRDENLADFDIDLLERRLRRAKSEKPRSVSLYNQIGNFWRIKGNAQRAIECFRRALAVSPHNAEVLLNLAQLMLVLEYLDDASYLARRSLELQPPDRNAWEQYLTLGLIFKAYGHFQEAAVHLRHALELKPNLEEAAKALKEVETLPIASIHVYTLLIIVCLVLGVLLVVLSSVECEEESTLASEQPQRPSQRHFNRAMTIRMRGLRLNVSRGKRC